MPATRTPSRRIVVLADRGIEALGARDLRLLADAAADSHVLIVAPAGPVHGERWIVDLTARRTRARERLEAWAALLAPNAHSLDSEVGDENPRLALADARRGHRPDAVVALEPPAALAAPRTSWLARLARDRLDAASAPGALPAAG